MRVTRAIAMLAVSLAVTADLHAQDDVRAAAFIGLARVNRDSGNLADAARYYQQARGLRPLSLVETTEFFWIVRAVDPRQTLEAGRDILRATPHDDNVRDTMIGAAVALNDEPSVVALSLEGRRVSGDPARWNRRLGESCLRTGRVSDAADAYLAAAESTRGRPADRLAAAAAFTSAERYAEALAAWRIVPAELLNQPDMARLRLLAFVRSTPLPGPASQLSSCLRSHPFDPAVQGWLVDAYTDARNFSAAYTAAQPLTTGPDADRWLRRRADLARAGGLTSEAASSYEALVRSPRATHGDRVALATLLIDQGAVGRALPVLDSLVARLRSCDEQVLSLIDRVPDAAGTDRLKMAAERAGCVNSRWGQRIVERSVAERRYDVALAAITQTPASSFESARLRGQLQLWTGAAAEAVTSLGPLVTERPGDVETRSALVDALRAAGRPYDAFAVAAPLIDDGTMPSDRLVALADLAVDADRPAIAYSILARARDFDAPAAAAVHGRALLDEGKPADAATVLSAIDPEQLSPSAALALVDAVLSTAGVEAARTTGNQFPRTSPPWRHVAIRRLTIAIMADDDATAARLRQDLCSADAGPCQLAEADAHLRAQQPRLALTDLRAIPDGADDRVDAIRAAAFEAIGDAGGALPIVTRLQERSPLNPALAFRRLVLEWRVGRTPATLDQLVAFAEAHRSDAHVQASTARLLMEAGDAVRARAALVHVPSSDSTVAPLRARLLTELANDTHREGDSRLALSIAREAIEKDATYAPAWFIALDAATAERSPEDVLSLVQKLASVSTADPALLPAVGDHVASVVQGRELLARHLIALLEVHAGSAGMAPAVAEVRLYAALEDWAPALQLLDRMHAQSPRSPEVLRLRADVLGWAGQHAASIDAYDEYLELAPSDVDAQRQQARVTGWSGRYGEANRRYSAIGQRYPTDATVAAEADAKRAFYAGQWRTAVGAYDKWIRLEPASSEARFERAVALRSAGNTVEANAALSDLAVQSGHRLAALALDRSDRDRRPAASIANDYQSASGFGGARLLSLQQQRAVLSLPVGDGTTARIGLSVGTLRAESDVRSRPGYRAAVNANLAVSPRLALEGHAGVWALSSSNTPDARMAASWTWTDRIALVGGVQQEAMQENLATVDNGLVARGPFAGLRIATPKGSLDTTMSWQRLSDGNTRSDWTVSAGRIVSERLQALRLIAWGQSLRYASRQALYFSPGTFLRIDAGAEFTRLLRRPRFAGDRQSGVALSFVEGTDNHGVLYHHPGIRLNLQLARRVAVRGHAEWIRSSSYRETSLFVGLDLTDLARH